MNPGPASAGESGESSRIKRLAGERPEWRLRADAWRERFTRDPEERLVVIQRVLPRGSAYRD